MLTNPVCFLHDNVQSWQIDVIYFNSSNWAQKVGIRVCVGVWRYILAKGTDCILGRQFLAGYLNCVDVHGYCNVTRSLSSLLVNFMTCLLTERQITASKSNVPRGLLPLKFSSNYLLFLSKWQSTEKSIGQSGISWIIPVLEISCPCRPDARTFSWISVVCDQKQIKARRRHDWCASLFFFDTLTLFIEFSDISNNQRIESIDWYFRIMRRINQSFQDICNVLSPIVYLTFLIKICNMYFIYIMTPNPFIRHKEINIFIYYYKFIIEW